MEVKENYKKVLDSKEANTFSSSRDLNFYKNLGHELKIYKRVHVNNSYVILFFDKNEIAHFVDYEHHNKVYNFDKKT